MNELFTFLNAFFQRQIRVLEWGVVNRPPPNADKLDQWIARGYHGEMSFMENNLEMRKNPGLMEDWAKSVVLFSFAYPVELKPFERKREVKMASYAQGLDYHIEIKKMLGELTRELDVGGFALKIRPFVDSAPVFERDLATEAGLGWRGKNACTIHKKHGSSFFIGGFLMDQQLPENYEIPQDFCGSCTRCIDMCPTQAIEEPGVINAQKCISYLTIEKKGVFSDKDMVQKLNGWAFGCDICQEVCPWNHKKIKSKESEMGPEAFQLTLKSGLELCRMGGGFKSAFKNTPLIRAGRKSLLRNLIQIAVNDKKSDLVDLIEEILRDEKDAELTKFIEESVKVLKNV